MKGNARKRFCMRVHRRRRGVVLAAALACVFVTVLLSAALASSALHRHRQLKLQERQLQAEWIAQSALGLAAARLKADAAYAGETWTAGAAELESRQSGRAVISIAELQDGEGRRVTIEVIYPDDPVDRIRIEKTIKIGPPGSNAAGS
jgi:hypothetical protein